MAPDLDQDGDVDADDLLIFAGCASGAASPRASGAICTQADLDADGDIDMDDFARFQRAYATTP